MSNHVVSRLDLVTFSHYRMLFLVVLNARPSNGNRFPCKQVVSAPALVPYAAGLAQTLPLQGFCAGRRGEEGAESGGRGGGLGDDAKPARDTSWMRCWSCCPLATTGEWLTKRADRAREVG